MPTLRRIRIFPAVLLALSVVVVVVWVQSGVVIRWRLHTADSSYYPRVLRLVETSPTTQREELLRYWASYTRYGDRMISSVDLHRFLSHFGFCTNLLSRANCVELPVGTEAQGIAKDELAELSAELSGGL